MIDAWAHIMLVLHKEEAHRLRSRDDLRNLPHCNDPTCEWNGEMIRQLPYPFPHRIKNLIVDEDLLCSVFPSKEFRPPFLFCTKCECGDCTPGQDGSGEVSERVGHLPAYLQCRRIDTGGDQPGSDVPCKQCGWGAKYPTCPTFQVLYLNYFELLFFPVLFNITTIIIP